MLSAESQPGFLVVALFCWEKSGQPEQGGRKKWERVDFAGEIGATSKARVGMGDLFLSPLGEEYQKKVKKIEKE